jgi:hypothetical protein
MLKVILAILLILVVILGWKSLGSNNQTYQSSPIAKMYESSSQVTVILSRTVDSDGADIVIGQIGSAVDGLVIHIPPGAMEKADRISLGYSMRSIPITTGESSGIVISLYADTVTRFIKPVRIDLRYRKLPLPSMAIPYSIDAKGRLHGMQLVKVYERNSTVVFDTFTPGDFTWVYP